MFTFNILHLSDLHISDERGIRRPRRYRGRRDIIEELSRWCNNNYNKFDAILITGDLVDQARECDLELASAFIDSPPDFKGYLATQQSSFPGPKPPSFPTINKSDKPIFLLPGNHDRIPNIIGYPSPGSNLFNKYFEQYWDVECDKGVKPFLIPFSNGSVFCIIAADFSLRSRDDASCTSGVFGQGFIDQNRLKLLEEYTTLIKSKDIPITWAIHFAPNYDSLGEAEALINSNLLVDLAVKNDIKHIFCGHTHKTKSYSINGSSLNVYCNGTSVCRCGDWDTSFFIHKIEIDNNNISNIINDKFIWSKTYKRFFKD